MGSLGVDMRRNFATADDRLSQLTQGARQETAPVISDLNDYLAKNAEVMPRVIHLDWCVCSVKDFKVLDSANAFVNPGFPLDPATTQTTLVTQSMIDQHGLTFAAALEKVSILMSLADFVQAWSSRF